MIDRASVEARRRFGSVGLQRTFVRGAGAFLNGLPLDACPYPSRRRGRRRRGWSRVWRAAWVGGYLFAQADRRHPRSR